MEPRERILTALDVKMPDRVPKALSFYSVDLEDLAPPGEDLHWEIEVRHVEFKPSDRDEEFRRYLEGLPEDLNLGSEGILRTYSDWGYRPGERVENPLSFARTVEEIEGHNFPDVSSEYRYRELKSQTEVWQSQGFAVACLPPHLGGELFETAWRLRGFSNFMLDLIYNRDIVNYLLDQLTDMAVQSSRVIAEAGVDILVLDDDVGMPDHMIISPDMWRDLLKPRMAGIIAEARKVKPDIRVLYHSDGYYEPIVPDLIEIGVNALNPIQPDRMNPDRMKALYGDRVAFWGAIGDHNLMAAGGPKDVRSEVRRRIETMGRGGGYIACPAYDVDSGTGTPWENIRAFLDAVDEFGAYVR
ncbi:MAG: uroporphyrinogen decarboxylase family protein [bacterium]